MKDAITFFGGIALVSAIVMAVIFAIAYWVMANGCDARWVDFDNRFGVWEGCMVEFEGTWYPDEVIRTLLSR